MSENINNKPDFITLSSYPKAIIHVDCDAFFASCEQAKDPGLKEKPVVTGKERGIIACASYEAKAYGVKRGVRLEEAKRLCPSLIVLPSDYETYSIYSERMFNILRGFTPEVEEFSIDEGFADLTGLRRFYRTSYVEIARRIKKEIENELDISVSLGLCLSKTLAKICSKVDKPGGFRAVPGRELHIFLKDTTLENVCGFGPNTVALLNKQRINTVLDYVKRPRAFAGKLLGKIGIELWEELRGVPIYKISRENKEKYLTISKTKTFMPASENRDFVKGQLMRNLESAFIKARRHGLSARNITIYLRTADFKGQALLARLTRHSSSTLDFTEIAARLFKALFRRGASYRATGVILSDIVEEGVDSRDLFEDPARVESMASVSRAIDEINTLYGKHTLHLAVSNAVNRKKRHARNDLAWRKKNLLKGEDFRKRLRMPLFKCRSA